ncbi:MAG: hypothetical protein ACOY3P_09585 [Planctomycetota bacterium]
MIDADLQAELLRQVERLSPDDQEKVVTFAAHMADLHATASGDRPWMNLAGIWPEEDANEVMRAIEEHCEQVNPNDW